MTSKHSIEPFWINEPDWLCAVEFLNDEDTEGRDLAADAIGYLLGYARLTNTRPLRYWVILPLKHMRSCSHFPLRRKRRDF